MGGSASGIGGIWSDSIREKLGDSTVSICYTIGEISAPEEKTGAIETVNANSNHLSNCYFLDNVANATPNGALFETVKKLPSEQ